MSDYQEISGGSNDPVWNSKGALSEGDQIEGKFTRMKNNVGPNDSTLLTIETSEGPTSVWANAVLETKFEQVPVGSPVRITYLGMKDSEKGGRSYHDYKVEAKPIEGADAVSAAFPDAKEEPAAEAPVDDIPDFGDKKEEAKEQK